MIRYDWEFVYAKCFHCLFGETERESEGRELCASLTVQFRNVGGEKMQERYPSSLSKWHIILVSN